MEWSFYNGKRFSEFTGQPDENGAYYLLPGILSRIFRRSREKGPRNGTILANGKGISRIPFRTGKVDNLWRLSTISEQIFRKIAFPFDLKPEFPDFLAKW